jgi:hypothetical protein
MFLSTSMKNLYLKNKQKGVSVVETVVYVSILALVSLVLVNSLYSLGRSYQSMRRVESIETTAQVALEKMVRNIRNASSVNIASSQLGLVNGSLTINSVDDTGAVTPIRFFLQNGRVRIEENGIDRGPLSPLDANVTELVFHRITTAQSEAVKIEMKVESSRGSEVQTKKFYSTAVLRGSYLP